MGGDRRNWFNEVRGDTQFPRSHVSPGSGGSSGRRMLDEGVVLGKESGVGEAVVVGFAEYDVVKHADAEDF